MSRLDELIAELCPNGVEYKSIGEISTDIYRGSSITRDQVTKEGTPCVRYGEIYTTYGVWFDQCVSHTNVSKISNAKYFEHGDILFAMIGTIGNPVLVKKEREFSIKNMALFKPIEASLLDMQYVLLFLRKAQVDMKKIANASVQSFVSLTLLRNYLFPLPPFAEQKRIVAKLESLLPLCDRLK